MTSLPLRLLEWFELQLFTLNFTKIEKKILGIGCMRQACPNIVKHAPKGWEFLASPIAVSDIEEFSTDE